MAEARGIEILSVSFTAGIVAGAMLPGTGLWLPSALLATLCLPFFFYRPLLRLPRERAVPLLAFAFSLLGIFCAWNSAQPGIPFHGPLETLALEATEGLRKFIDSVPFRDPGTAPLLRALLTGDRSGLSADTVAIFRRSGASHLLALSGLHIGIIYLIFDRLTRVLGRSPAARKVRFALVILGAGFYTLATGAGPSIVRAFLFIAISETLRLLERPRQAVRVLCLALLIHLVITPEAIRSVGFQLSYLAMAGIFLVYPLLEKWYPASPRWDPCRKVWNMAALTLSCQLFTAPLVWVRFHSFPRYFLLTNLLAIPATTALMGTALLTLTLQALGLCPALLLTTTDSLSRLLLWILTVIASL